MTGLMDIAIHQSHSLETLNDPALIARELAACKDYTQQVYDHLPAQSWELPYLSTVNPMAWEIAHIAWFQEYWCVRGGYQRFLKSSEKLGASVWAESDALFDSRTVAHRARWRKYPDRQAIYDYQDCVLHNTLAALSRVDDEHSLYPFQLAVLHERMHQEAMLMTLATLGLPIYAVVAAPAPINAAGTASTIQVPAGIVTLGTRADERRFAFDNERKAIDVEVMSFDIDAQPISNAQFKAFLQSDAYNDDRTWIDSDEAFLKAKQSGQWQSRATIAAYPDAPAMHVNYFEASAYARWKGRTLPSQAQWIKAHRDSHVFRSSVGHVWEWTRDVFAPFPGFTPGPYAEYSKPWFGDHHVLKGGSWATNALLKYPEYQNFYRPERNDMFCGFRTVSA
jgi:gamma-glutamyl hercynylcysteine S-oxide synthase